MSYHGGGDYRRSSSSSNRRDRDSDRDRDRERRRYSPESSHSRGRSPKRDTETGIPEAFGRIGSDDRDDDLNILEKMKVSFAGGPLELLYECIRDKSKTIKVWTRNFKEVRGICSGKLIAFDKHWNLVLSNMEEVYLKPRKNKTPFLRDVSPDEAILEMEPKVPRKKKTPEELAEIKARQEAEAAKRQAENPDKPKKKRKKKGSVTLKRKVNSMFVRGDNIVMIAVVNAEDQEPEAEGEASEAQGTP